MKTKKLIVALSEGLFEREEVVALSLLSALSGQSIFLFGLPGTAKSLIARRLSKAFKEATHFEYLMQRFSTPEDVFGPVSIQELKQDKYIRKTKGYLPTADIAFLDEIWKSSPAILNTLLTIINERIFRNGETESIVPLKALIAASNETPPPNQGLDALYDRFVMRVVVDPMQERTNFENLLTGSAVHADINIPQELQFSHDEWKLLLEQIPMVKISKEVLDIIHAIKLELESFNQYNPELSVYVSDRRWQKIALVLKTAAHLCGRQEVIPVDSLILRHCLWTLPDNRVPIEEIIEACISNYSTINKDNLEKWSSEYADIENEVKETFYHTEDIYDTQEINGEECFAFTFDIQTSHSNSNQIMRFIPVAQIKKNNDFKVYDEDGNLEKRLLCNFNGGKTCTVNIDSDVKQYGWNRGYTSNKFVEFKKVIPPIKIKKGSTKPVTPRTKETYKTACKDLLSKIQTIVADTSTYINEAKIRNETPFVPDEKRKIVLTAFNDFMQELDNHKLNAEHLLEKVNSHANTK